MAVSLPERTVDAWMVLAIRRTRTRRLESHPSKRALKAALQSGLCVLDAANPRRAPNVSRELVPTVLPSALVRERDFATPVDVEEQRCNVSAFRGVAASVEDACGRSRAWMQARQRSPGWSLDETCAVNSLDGALLRELDLATAVEGSARRFNGTALVVVKKRTQLALRAADLV